MPERPRCAGCGRPAAYATTTQYERLVSWDGPPEFPPYRGNLRVTRQTVERHKAAYGGGRVEHTALLTRWLWDGESYRPLYEGLFCTLRCSLAFAVLAYRAGHRRR